MATPVVRPTALLGMVCLALALSGCTSAPEPAGSTGAPPPPGKTTSATPSPTVTIEPVIVVAAVDIDGQHVTASGYVQGTIEDGGTCSFAFAREGSPTVTVDHEAIADRGSTACGVVQPEIGRFTRGSWTVTLTYSSETGTFRSAPQTVEVP